MDTSLPKHSDLMTKALISDNIPVQEQTTSLCGDCTDHGHTAITIPAENESTPDTQADRDNDMFNRGSSAWRRALLVDCFDCPDTAEGIQELTGGELEDSLMKLAFANFVREYPHFRRFDLLNYLNLTLMQDDLVHLQREVERTDSPFSEENHRVKLRNLLESYNNALLAYNQVCNLSQPPESHVWNVFASAAKCTHNTEYPTQVDSQSMVSLRSVESTDIVRKYLKTILPARLTETEKSRRHRKDIQHQLDRFRPQIELTEDGVSDTVDYLARFIISLTGCILLIAPMVALSFIKENKYRLLTVSLFLVVFALSCSLAAFKLTVQELLGAAAAYAAVLVVFISSTPTL